MFRCETVTTPLPVVPALGRVGADRDAAVAERQPVSRGAVGAAGDRQCRSVGIGLPLTASTIKRSLPPSVSNVNRGAVSIGAEKIGVPVPVSLANTSHVGPGGVAADVEHVVAVAALEVGTDIGHRHQHRGGVGASLPDR